MVPAWFLHGVLVSRGAVWFSVLLTNAWHTMLTNPGPTTRAIRTSQGLRCSPKLGAKCSPTLSPQRVPFASRKSHLRSCWNLDLDYAPVWSRQVRNQVQILKLPPCWQKVGSQGCSNLRAQIIQRFNRILAARAASTLLLGHRRGCRTAGRLSR